MRLEAESDGNPAPLTPSDFYALRKSPTENAQFGDEVSRAKADANSASKPCAEPTTRRDSTAISQAPSKTATAYPAAPETRPAARKQGGQTAKATRQKRHDATPKTRIRQRVAHEKNEADS